MNNSIFIIPIISILIIISLSTPSDSLSQPCNKNDEKVLFQIKESLGNPYHLASWTKDYDCCHWYCVKCNKTTGRIIELTIFSGNISGQIPPQVGDLPYLQNLVFRKLTNLTGTIPSTITKLTHLTSLRLSWTNLSGPVPSFLSKLTNLNFLDLSFNNLTGSIPPELSKLTQLSGIRLDRNKLTGTIPESLGTMTSGNLQYVYLSHNQLTGNIPKSFMGLNLQYLNVSYNKLCGEIPQGGNLQAFGYYEYWHNRCLCGSPMPACH